MDTAPLGIVGNLSISCVAPARRHACAFGSAHVRMISTIRGGLRAHKLAAFESSWPGRWTVISILIFLVDAVLYSVQDRKHARTRIWCWVPYGPVSEQMRARRMSAYIAPQHGHVDPIQGSTSRSRRPVAMSNAPGGMASLGQLISLSSVPKICSPGHDFIPCSEYFLPFYPCQRDTRVQVVSPLPIDGAGSLYYACIPSNRQVSWLRPFARGVS